MTLFWLVSKKVNGVKFYIKGREYMAIKDKFLDTIEIVGKTALSTIPIGGALATSVYDVVKGNSLAKRFNRICYKFIGCIVVL